MLLAAFEPGKEMAIANFFLAIFCLFTVALPLILITRGDKTEANRDFLAATVNPWFHLANKEVEPAPVVLTEIPTSPRLETNIGMFSEQSFVSITASEEDTPLDEKESRTQNESSTELSPNDDGLLVA